MKILNLPDKLLERCSGDKELATLEYLVDLAEMCRVSYSTSDLDHDLGVVKCNQARICDDVHIVSFKAPDATYISIRGSVTLKDWMSNFKALFRRRWHGMTCHRGFVQAAESAYDHVRILALGGRQKRVVLTGHSRGGAIAALLAVALEKDEHLTRYKDVQCITFGQPRFTTPWGMRKHYDGEFVRVVNGSDVVPRWPKAFYGHGDWIEFFMPNRSEGYTIDPGMISQFIDRSFTFTQRGTDHGILDYKRELIRCRDLVLRKVFSRE